MILEAQNETWVTVPKYDKYQVSNYGRIRSKARSRDWRVLNPCVGKNGYYAVSLGNGNTKHLHSIVALSFIGEPDGRFVNHKDGNKLNNNVSNLEYVTNSENVLHAFRTGLINNTGDLHGRATRTNNEVLIIREAVKCGHKQSAIARYFKASPQTINGIIKRRSYVSL